MLTNWLSVVLQFGWSFYQRLVDKESLNVSVLPYGRDVRLSEVRSCPGFDLSATVIIFPSFCKQFYSFVHVCLWEAWKALADECKRKMAFCPIEQEK